MINLQGFFRSRIKEYLPITGLADFNKLSAKLILGADRYKSYHSLLSIADIYMQVDK